MRIIETISNLPSAAKGALGLVGVFSALSGYLVFDTIARPPKSASVYNVENEIDQSLLPILDDPSRPPSKNQSAVMFPPHQIAPGQTCSRGETPRECDARASEGKESKKTNAVASTKNKTREASKETASSKKKSAGSPRTNIESNSAPNQTSVAATNPTTNRKARVATQTNAQSAGLSQKPIVLPAIEVTKEPALRASDPKRATRLKFNKKRQGFSNVSYSPLIATREQAPAKDKNVTSKWPVKANANTYPTDLSRVITKEKFIFATLNNRIVSSFSGRVLLTISQNIYGSHGNKILIPIGAKASGSYKAVEEIGVERLLIHIERVVTPDGQLILLKKQSSVADQQGATGIKGEIDNKYLEKFGLPLAFSIANNTTTLLFQKLVDSVSSDADEVSDLAQIFNEQWSKDQSATNREIISDIIKNNINIMPTITIEPGQQLLLYLEHDIFFKPNKNGVTEVVRDFNY